MFINGIIIVVTMVGYRIGIKADIPYSRDHADAS
jgi:hypothetical protein